MRSRRLSLSPFHVGHEGTREAEDPEPDLDTDLDRIGTLLEVDLKSEV
jgi:hypothetical protein